MIIARLDFERMAIFFTLNGPIGRALEKQPSESAMRLGIFGAFVTSLVPARERLRRLCCGYERCHLMALTWRLTSADALQPGRWRWPRTERPHHNTTRRREQWTWPSSDDSGWKIRIFLTSKLIGPHLKQCSSRLG